jgi:hypothetical protein
MEAYCGVTFLFFVGSCVAWISTGLHLAQYHSVPYRVTNSTVEKNLCMENLKPYPCIDRMVEIAWNVPTPTTVAITATATDILDSTATSSAQAYYTRWCRFDQKSLDYIKTQDGGASEMKAAAERFRVRLDHLKYSREEEEGKQFVCWYKTGNPSECDIHSDTHDALAKDAWFAKMSVLVTGTFFSFLLFILKCEPNAKKTIPITNKDF